MGVAEPWELGGFPLPQGGKARADRPAVPEQGQSATGYIFLSGKHEYL